MSLGDFPINTPKVRRAWEAATRSVGYDKAAEAWHKLDSICERKFARLLRLPAPTPKAIAAKVRAFGEAWEASGPDEPFAEPGEFASAILADLGKLQA